MKFGCGRWHGTLVYLFDHVALVLVIPGREPTTRSQALRKKGLQINTRQYPPNTLKLHKITWDLENWSGLRKASDIPCQCMLSPSISVGTNVEYQIDKIHNARHCRILLFCTTLTFTVQVQQSSISAPIRATHQKCHNQRSHPHQPVRPHDLHPPYSPISELSLFDFTQRLS